MALNVWTKPSGYSFGTIQERVKLVQELPVANDTGVTYRVISGSLPRGLTIDTNTISGTPFEVSRITEYTFCIRASDNLGNFADRTFTMTVEGADQPTIVTPAGTLAVGPYQQFFVLDSAFVDYQIQAFDEDTAAGQVLSYFIAYGDGQLPPGLVLTDSGRITGFVQPSIALRPEDGDGTYDNSYYDAYAFDFAVRPSNGYDSYFYDTTFFDYSIKTNQPKKLNRTFEFTVTVTDGDSIIKRTFKIYVVGDDYFRSDNTRILDEGLFTADVTYLRSPIWITGSNLGTYRANNYITLVLDTYDTQNVLYNYEQVNADIITYTEQLTATDNALGTNHVTIKNPSGVPVYGQFLTFANELFLDNVDTSKVYQIIDVEALDNNAYRLTLAENLVANIPNGLEFYIGSLSTLPPGLSFDIPTAELYGTVPYQPAITKSYSFSVTAKRLSDNTETVKSARKFTIDIIGEIDSVITWNTSTDLGSIDANYVSTLSVNATSTVPNAIVLYTLTSGRLPPGLSLDLSGEIVGKPNQYGDGTYVSGNLVYSTGGLTTFSEYSGSIKGQGTKTFSNTTYDKGITTFDRTYTFTVQAKDQYGLSATTKTFKVHVNTPNQLLYSNIRVKPFLKLDQRTEWKTFINDNDVFTSTSIYRPNDPNFGVQTELSMLVYGGVETRSAAEYISAIGLNHKRKRFQFGDIKKATAIIPGTTKKVYEVVYVEMIDPLEPNGKRLPHELKNIGLQTKQITVDNSSVFWQSGFAHGFDSQNQPLEGMEQAINLLVNGSKIDNLSVTAPDSTRPDPIITIDSTAYTASNSNAGTYFPNSISNWRDNINAVGEQERNYLPLWMRSIQPGDRQELGFQLAVPLCYCLVGTADDIILNIKYSGFDFKMLDYTADRYIIDSVTGQATDKYLVFRNDRITV